MKIKSLVAIYFLSISLLKAQIITTIAGNGTPGYVGDGGAASSCELNYPIDVAIDTTGNIYIADNGNGVIRKINSLGNVITFATINDPIAITCDLNNNVYVASQGDMTVIKINSSGVKNIVAGISNGLAGYSGDGAAATAATLNYPYGIATDVSGNLYISTSGDGRIRKVSTNGIISTIAGNGGNSHTGDGGQATLASLSVPRGINFDNLGNLYIAEQNGYSIRKINMSSGIITTIAGNAIIGDSASGDGGAATLAQLYGPTDIVVDTTGNLYISDMGNQLIRIVNTNGIINTVAGDGYKSSACCGGFSGDGGQATLAELNNPWGLLIDKSGSLIIADWYNHRIRKVSTPLLGINQIGIEHNFSIFPNPSNGDININGTNNIDEIKVTDVFGQNVYEVKAHITNTILLTLENAGVYFVTITSDKEVSAKKVIINK